MTLFHCSCVFHAVQVLDTILHADRLLFEQLPGLAGAAVVVHLSSHLTVSHRLSVRESRMGLTWSTRFPETG